MFLLFLPDSFGFLLYFFGFLLDFFGFLSDEEEVSWRDYCSISEGVVATCGRLVQQWVITKVNTGGLDEEKEDYNDFRNNADNVFEWAIPSCLFNNW